ncbi:unnamed protein product [Adineta steineri]|uniref:Uncharacterized protein n=1 Tax=Adineta steineri TaxID=433720 RepID=A0A818HGX4_9BILA|nr:unnamed protein product [Adineta steineri]CAF3506042.1 unnamed protein product [Adineta steineri]
MLGSYTTVSYFDATYKILIYKNKQTDGKYDVLVVSATQTKELAVEKLVACGIGSICVGIAVSMITTNPDLGYKTTATIVSVSVSMGEVVDLGLGILTEESGDATEILLFGFRIQHYGPSDPKFLVRILNQFNFTITILLRVIDSVRSFSGISSASEKTSKQNFNLKGQIKWRF